MGDRSVGENEGWNFEGLSIAWMHEFMRWFVWGRRLLEPPDQCCIVTTAPSLAVFAVQPLIISSHLPVGSLA